MSTIEERTVPDSEDVQPTLADRKRFLNLSKIAYMAGMRSYLQFFFFFWFPEIYDNYHHVSDKDADSKSKVKRIEADLNLLKLQVNRFSAVLTYVSWIMKTLYN